MTAFITLLTSTTNTGPFSLYSNTDGYISAFESNISRSSLISGYPTDNIPRGTSMIRIMSNGQCTNFIDIPFTPATTTNTTLNPCNIYTVKSLSGDFKEKTIVDYIDCNSGVVIKLWVYYGAQDVNICAKSILNVSPGGIVTKGQSCSGPSPCRAFYIESSLIPGETTTVEYIDDNGVNRTRSVNYGDYYTTITATVILRKTGSGSLTNYGECVF